MDRRTFLRHTGALSAAGAALPLSGCIRVRDRDEAEPESVTGGGETAAGETEASPTADGTALRVGLLVPTSGVYSTLGTTMIQGFNLFVDQRSDDFAGRTVEVVTVDEGETAQSGVDAAERLLSAERVDLVVGIVNSAVALNVRDLFHEQRIPLVIANAGAAVLTGAAASPYIFRTSFSNPQPNYAMGQYLHDEVTDRGVFLIAPDYASGAEQMVGFRTAYEAAGGTVIGESFPPFVITQDYGPYLEEIRAADATAVFAFFAGSEAVRFVQQYAASGLKDTVPLLGPGFLTDETVLGAQGEAAEGVLTSLHWALDLANDTNTAFVEGYRQAYAVDPTLYAVQAYDAAQLLALGLQATGGDTADVDVLAEAMGAVGQIDSPRAPFELDEGHNPVQNFYLRRVEGGRNVFVQDLGLIGNPLA